MWNQRSGSLAMAAIVAVSPCHAAGEAKERINVDGLEIDVITRKDVNFQGRLGHRSATGAFVPIRDASVLMARGADACAPSSQPTVEFTTQPDGSFSLPISQRCWAERLLVQKPIRPCTEADEIMCFRLTAPGCDDQTIIVDKRWQPRDIELECPGRTTR